jgi:hypothetical protein
MAQMITGTAPPSTDHAAPTTLDAGSEHRNTITADRTRRHRVHQHLALGVQVGEGPRQRQLGGLGHRVRHVRAGRPLARRGAHVDDPPPAALRHRGRGRAHQPHRRHHVQLPLGLPLLIGELLEGANRARARVVDQRVDSAEPLQTTLHEALAGVRGGHVERERRAAAAGALARPRQFGQRLPAPPDQHHRSALPRKRQGRGAADATGRPCHDAGATAQAQIHGA